MKDSAIDWIAVSADPRFQALCRRRRSFVGSLLTFVLCLYFLLPMAAAYRPDWLALPVAGAINLGLLLALAEFLAILAVAAVYVWRANREFDRLAEEINDDIFAGRLPHRAS